MRQIAFLILGLSITVTGLKAQNVNIPDPNFKAYLVGNTNINTNNDSEIQLSEAQAFSGTIDCNSQNISNLSGIEQFINITSLSCWNNQLTSLDVSNNLQLTLLMCDANQLSSLQIGNNNNLITLSCNNNQLTSLNLTTATGLNNLICNHNLLTGIDLSSNTELYELQIYNNQLSTIDISNNILLDGILCYNNLLTSLDLSSNINLTNIACHNNQLTSLNVANGNNMNIAYFNASSNQALSCIEVDNAVYSNANWSGLGFNFDAGINFSENCSGSTCVVTIPDANFKAYLIANNSINTNGNGEIECSEAQAFSGTIDCNNLGINSLDGIEAFTGLTQLLCYNNALTTLDLSNNTALNTLNCNFNQLSTLNVSNNTLLTHLYCNFNQITSLDVTSNIGLIMLQCFHNQLNTLDISSNINLLELHCLTNTISNLNLSSNSLLTKLDCRGNEISTLDLSSNVALTQLDCQNNDLSSLDIANGNNINMTSVYAKDNPQLRCIKVDDPSYAVANWTGAQFQFDAGVNFDENCISNTSIEDVSANQIRIYPNPSSDFIFFTTPADATLKTIEGKTVVNKTNASSLQLSDFASGIYYLTLTHKGRTLLNAKIIKQ